MAGESKNAKRLRQLLESRRSGGSVVLRRPNHSLLAALTGTSIYGPDAKDAEIRKIIINSEKRPSIKELLDEIRQDFSNKLESGEIRKVKDHYENKSGQIVIRW